jgi:hypothetical protein
MLYVPGAALLGRFSATVSVAGVLAVTGTGFGGVTVHCPPEIAVALQVTLIEPL